MKSLTRYIQEKLVIKKSNNYKYSPETKEELKEIIEQRIETEGNEANLNDIDTSKITDMSGLFMGLNFNGDISNWDVSNVRNMNSMFYYCELFNQDISDWNVSNVQDMSNMFAWCKSFNQDISEWDVSKVTDMTSMFFGCKKFNQEISCWNVSNVKDMREMFYRCESFNQDISNWDVSNATGKTIGMFNYCPIQEKYKPKFK